MLSGGENDDKGSPLDPAPTTSEVTLLPDNEIQPADDSISNNVGSTHMPAAGSVNNIVQPPPDVDVDKLKPPKSSYFFMSKAWHFIKSKPKRVSEVNNAAGHDEETHNESEALMNLIKADLDLIDNVKTMVNTYIDLIAKEHTRYVQLKENGGEVESIRQMKKRVKMLKQLVTSKHKDEYKDSNKHKSLRADDSADDVKILDPNVLQKMPSLYASKDLFVANWAFKDFQARYNALDKELKLCLLCFSVFPENEIIKKRVMIYWWIGEGFATPSPGNTQQQQQQLQPNDNLSENTLQETLNGDDDTLQLNATSVIQDAVHTEDTDDHHQRQKKKKNSTPSGRSSSSSSSKDGQEKGDPSEITQKENKTPDGTINQKQNGTSIGNKGKEIVDQTSTKQWSSKTNSLPNKLTAQSTSTIQVTTAVEGASTATKKTAEDCANEFFKELIDKGFIEPVHEKHPPLTQGKIAGSCKLHPFTRSMVIILAKNANFFDFDEKKGSPVEQCSNSLRACLTGKVLNQNDKLERLHTLFNVNEETLEFKPELLGRMKNLNVLYLGRWQSSAKHHIEVEDMKNLKNETVSVLNGLENLNHLKFLSIQGISRITELPKSFCRLSKLTILDIRACHNLELLPEEIGLLENLTHLDMSECYLLDQMPKGLSSLRRLQVLKGFVVTEDADEKKSCKLDELLKLPLRKLSIYTGLMNFPSETDLRSFNGFKKLLTLTIAWGRGSLQDTAGQQEEGGGGGEATSKKKKKANNSTSQSSPKTKNTNLELPSQLKKLSLVCFPRTETPEWMKPSKLGNLKSLHIRGGKFSDLGQIQDVKDDAKAKWNVEVLRLKYLDELEMEWGEFLEMFPNVSYLEKVRCPKLTFFPCNQSGVWVRKPKKKNKLEGVTA